MRSLIKVVIKPSVLEEAKTFFLLLKIDLNKAEIRVVTSLTMLANVKCSQTKARNKKVPERALTLRCQNAPRKKSSPLCLI